MIGRAKPNHKANRVICLVAKNHRLSEGDKAQADFQNRLGWAAMRQSDAGSNHDVWPIFGHSINHRFGVFRGRTTTGHQQLPRHLYGVLSVEGDGADAEVVAAFEAIGALERFEQMRHGLLTEVRERGSRLSAGERQLVSLARAALVDPAVLVLDEATSNLDPGTEAVVEHALERLMQGRTTIVVAHRLSTVQRADRIVVVDRARVVEVGTHDELVAAGGRYAALAAAWARSQPA